MTPDALPEPPTPPDPQNCCQRGCAPCIFDYYDAAFARWEAQVRALGVSPEAALAALGRTKASRPLASRL